MYKPILLALLITSTWTTSAYGDAVTDWNEYAIKATKGFNGTTGTGATLNSNLSTRIEAIAARAVFDAINAINPFSPNGYYYKAKTNNKGSAAAAAAQAAHDVLLSQLPNPSTADIKADPRWKETRAWLDVQLSQNLTALGVAADDPGIQVGKAAAAAAIAARERDNAKPNKTYGGDLGPTSNPGIGLWRQCNAGGDIVDPVTGAPTGFDATGKIVGKPGIDLNWGEVTPFSLTFSEKTKLVAAVPSSPQVGSPEYLAEVDFVKKYGQNTSTARTADQTAQALYYKLDAEIFINEAARIASKARQLKLEQNAKLFAALANALADSRIATYASKYKLKFWRPITALNADAKGAVSNNYQSWRPLAATPPHPSSTAGHSATGAAGFAILRAFFGDKITLQGTPVTLGTLSWLTGTNSGTGKVVSRNVSTFTQAQLENGASRLYMGVHFGYDNLQGQLLGLSVADTILQSKRDPATAGLSVRQDSTGSSKNIKKTLSANPNLYGYFGKSTIAP